MNRISKHLNRFLVILLSFSMVIPPFDISANAIENRTVSENVNEQIDSNVIYDSNADSVLVENNVAKDIVIDAVDGNSTTDGVNTDTEQSLAEETSGEPSSETSTENESEDTTNTDNTENEEIIGTETDGDSIDTDSESELNDEEGDELADTDVENEDTEDEDAVVDDENKSGDETIVFFSLDSSVKLQKLAGGSTEEDIVLPETVVAFVRKNAVTDESGDADEYQEVTELDEHETSHKTNHKTNHESEDELDEQVEALSEEADENGNEVKEHSESEETSNESHKDEEIEVPVTWELNADISTKPDLEDMIVGDTYIFDGDVSTDYAIAENVKMPQITVVITNGEILTMSSECDEVLVTVTADEGVFPEGAYIKAERDENFGDILNEAEGGEDIDGSVWAINVTVFDSEGNEIQPDTSKGEVRVSFTNPNDETNASEWEIYHYNESGNTLEELETGVDELTGEITAGVESFSTFMMVLGATGNVYNLNSGDAKIRVTSDNQNVTIKNGDGHKNRVLIYNDTGSDATVNIHCEDVHTYTGDRGAPVYIYSQNHATTVVLYSIPKNAPYFGTTKHKAIDWDGKGGAKIMGAVESDVPGASAGFIFECFSQFYIFFFSDPHALANNGIQVTASPGYYMEDAYALISADGYHTTDIQRASDLMHKSTVQNWICLTYTNQADVDYYYNFSPDSSAIFKSDKVFRNEGLTKVSEYPDVFGYYFLGWNEKADGSGKTYYPGQDYYCTRYDNKLYGVSERIKNTATVNLFRDEAKWTGQRVELYEGKECKYTLNETSKGSGIYTNKEVFNGYYDVYVNGEKSDQVFAFDSKKREGLKKSVDAKYNKYVIKTYLEDTMTPSIGEVSLRKNGMTLHRLNSNTGEYTKDVLVSDGALEIFVADRGTDHYVSSSNRVENMYYYNATVNITDSRH